MLITVQLGCAGRPPGEVGRTGFQETKGSGHLRQLREDRAGRADRRALGSLKLLPGTPALACVATVRCFLF